MMDDLISRKQAIDALCSQCTVDKPETCSTIQKGDNWCEEVYILQKVPSAQPEQSETKDATYWKKRTREYEEMLVELTTKIAKGMTVGSVVIKKDEIVFKESQPEPQWILCSERLPDIAQRVLLSGHEQVMVGMLHSSGKYSLEPTGISYVYPKDDIQAWMPLPEPYKEGDANG